MNRVKSCIALFRCVTRLCLPALLVWGLSACGGGSGGDGSVRTEAAVTAPPSAAAQAQAAAPTPPPVPNLVVRAHSSMAANVGAIMELRIDGSIVATVEVRSAEPADHTFAVPTLKAGSKVEIVFTNDEVISVQDRNLFVAYLQSGATLLLPGGPGVVYDRGFGAAAFDGLDTLPGRAEMHSAGALRLNWPVATTADPLLDAKQHAARFLHKASFGPTLAQVDRVAAIGPAAWIDEQIALPFTPDMVRHVQAKFDLGADRRPGGSDYSPIWVGERFWAMAANGPEQLRRRVGWSLHQMLTVSQVDSNLYEQARAYAGYVDTLNQLAFGNYRVLLEEVALSPVMGIYLSHMRNRVEDPATGRLPDENFARELMQLFTIGLVELNLDGTPRLDAGGRPIETYSNADVMAMAKVFTGWSWALPDNQLTDNNYRWGGPDLRAASAPRIDLLKMKAYPGQHSTSEKRLFAGKVHAVTIAAHSTASESVRIALDALFKHPNVGPFVGRQLIQRLVTSQPSPAYVARVAAAFNNNGQGVRGDMAAVVRAVLLDAEASSPVAASDFGKLVEPVLRVSRWMRAFGATSASGEYMMGYELDGLSQRALHAASVFSYFRPGYVPPNTAFGARGAHAPEFQIVNESTAAAWVNLAESMSGQGLGWNGSGRDVSSSYASLAAHSSSGNPAGLLNELDLLLFAGRMSAALRQALLDAVTGVAGNDGASHVYRARVAVFLALASPEYMVQR